MTERQRYDDAVVGAGILGLAHAYHLARRRRRVIVFERIASRMGASVRNFGMLWPIGQPLGPLRRLAMRSLAVLARSAGVERPLARADRITPPGIPRRRGTGPPRVRRQEMLAHGELSNCKRQIVIGQRTSAVKLDGLQLALWSPHEVCVDPREVIAGLPEWLSRRFGVVFQFGRTITAVEMPGRRRPRELVGRPAVDLFGRRAAIAVCRPIRRTCGLVRCKLQMMRSDAYGASWRIGPMLAGGLTLRHYSSFQNCPSLPALTSPCQPRSRRGSIAMGFMCLVSQNGHGELTIGDSHEYGDLDRALRQDRNRQIDPGLLAHVS